MSKTKNKTKEDDQIKLILHFNVDKTIILRNANEYNNTDYSLKKLFCSQLWGRIEQKGDQSIFKAVLDDLYLNPYISDIASTKNIEPDLITYLSYIEEKFPIKLINDNDYNNKEEIESLNKDQISKRIDLILSVVDNGQPGNHGSFGNKLRKKFEDMKKKLKMDDKINSDYNFSTYNVKSYKELIESEDNQRYSKYDNNSSSNKNVNMPKSDFDQLDEDQKINILFKNSYHFIFNSFYNTIIKLTKEKRRFVIIFRLFDIDIEFAKELIFEFNSFCKGNHPKYNGRNGTTRQKFDENTLKSKDFRIDFDYKNNTGDNIAYYVRNPKNVNKENLIWDFLSVHKDVDDNLRDNIEEYFDGDSKNNLNLNIVKGYNDILLSTYEKLAQYNSLLFLDDNTLYIDNNYNNYNNNKSQKGKLVVIDPYDYETLNIVFDNNLHIDQNRVDIVDIVTGQKLDNQACMNKYLVNIDTRKAILEANYFELKIQECENNRKCEIMKLTQNKKPLMPLNNNFDLKKEIQKIDSGSYLEMSIYPLLNSVNLLY